MRWIRCTAAHGPLALTRAGVRRVLGIPGVLREVIGTHDAFGGKDGSELRSILRCAGYAVQLRTDRWRLRGRACGGFWAYRGSCVRSSERTMPSAGKTGANSGASCDALDTLYSCARTAGAYAGGRAEGFGHTGGPA